MLMTQEVPDQRWGVDEGSESVGPAGCFLQADLGVEPPPTRPTSSTKTPLFLELQHVAGLLDTLGILVVSGDL